ncbi:MAG: hypothetical protein WBR29_09795 [Gammaproteobacteria bacterium]
MKIGNATALAALLTLGLVAGCSGNASQNPQPGANASGTTTQQAPTPTTQPAPAPTTQQPPPPSI